MPNLTRTFTDGVANGTTTFTSATAAFQGADVGKGISGSGGRPTTTIASVTNSTTVVLSTSWAAGSGITFTLTAKLNIGLQGQYATFKDGVSASTSQLTSATAAFTSADTGRRMTANNGSGPGTAGEYTITFVNATTVTVSPTWTAGVSGIQFTIWGRTATEVDGNVEHSAPIDDAAVAGDSLDVIIGNTPGLVSGNQDVLGMSHGLSEANANQLFNDQLAVSDGTFAITTLLDGVLGPPAPNFQGDSFGFNDPFAVGDSAPVAFLPFEPSGNANLLGVGTPQDQGSRYDLVEPVVLGDTMVVENVVQTTIDNFVPAIGSLILPTTHVSFDTKADPLVGSLTLVTVSADYTTIADEVIHDGSSFIAPYLGSTRTNITNGYHWDLVRTGGWPQGFTLLIHTVDADSQIKDGSAAYSVDTVNQPPVIDGFIPANLSSLAQAGSVQFDVTDDIAVPGLITVFAVLSGLRTEVVYDGVSFIGKYSTSSVSDILTGPTVTGRHFTIQRTDGWPADVTIVVRVSDSGGNVVSGSSAYTITPAPGVPTASNFSPVAPGPLARTASLQFDVKGNGAPLQEVEVYRELASGLREVIYANGAFVYPYLGSSTSVITNGLHFTLLRTDGWVNNFVLRIAAEDTEGRDGNEPYLYDTTVDSSAPTVSNFSPSPGSAIFPTTPISFDVTDVDSGGLFRRILVHAHYPTQDREVVYDGEEFAPLFARSSIVPTSNGYSLTVIRSGGWRQAPSIKVFAIDQEGAED